MMKSRDAVVSKAKILSVAEDIFSRVGFDGARVEDIANEAGVNKALIYYYFKSKAEILETLFTYLIDDSKKMLVKFTEKKPEILDEELYRKLFDTYIQFVTEKRKIIKVALAESAKAEQNLDVVMKLSNLIIDSETEHLKKVYASKGMAFPGDKQDMLVMEFFTGLAPFFCYALFKEQWEDLYKIGEKELQDRIFLAFRKTHMTAHLP